LRDLAGIQKNIRNPREGRSNVKRQYQRTFITSVFRANHGGYGRVILEERRKSTPILSSSFVLAGLGGVDKYRPLRGIELR